MTPYVTAIIPCRDPDIADCDGLVAGTFQTAVDLPTVGGPLISFAARFVSCGTRGANLAWVMCWGAGSTTRSMRQNCNIRPGPPPTTSTDLFPPDTNEICGLSTIIDADRIVVLVADRIVEQGTHEDILTADGTRRARFTQQFGSDRDPKIQRIESEKV